MKISAKHYPVRKKEKELIHFNKFNTTQAINLITKSSSKHKPPGLTQNRAHFFHHRYAINCRLLSWYHEGRCHHTAR